MKLHLALALGLVATPVAAADITAVASFSILGDLVQQVGGDRVAVTTIVGPNADTHIYEPKPADAAAVTRTEIFFVNGLGLEGWMERFAQATGYTGYLVTVSDGAATDSFDAHGTIDPHAWQDLGNGAIYVDNIAEGLCHVDRGMCHVYMANAEAYVAQLRALDVEVRERIAAIPEAQRKVITTHDAFGYFGRAYGVTFLAPEGISTDAEPSAAAVARLITQIRTEGVKALFIENMSDGRLVQQIADETGATVGGELYADALSEPEGPAPSYIEMFRHNLDLLIPAMEGQ